MNVLSFFHFILVALHAFYSLRQSLLFGRATSQADFESLLWLLLAHLIGPHRHCVREYNTKKDPIPSDGLLD